MFVKKLWKVEIWLLLFKILWTGLCYNKLKMGNKNKPNNSLPIILIVIHNTMNITNILYIIGEFREDPTQILVDEKNAMKLFTLGIFVFFSTLNVFGLGGYKDDYQGVVVCHSLILCLASMIFMSFFADKIMNSGEFMWILYFSASAVGFFTSLVCVHYTQNLINFNWVNNINVDLTESLISGKCANCDKETVDLVKFADEGIFLCYDCVLQVRVLPKTPIL